PATRDSRDAQGDKIEKFIGNRTSARFPGPTLSLSPYAVLAVLRRKRKSSALFSSGRASARTSARTFAWLNAARTVWSPYLERKLFTSVLRFMANAVLRKAMNSGGLTWSSAKRGAIVRRSTAECTLGGGANAPGGSVKRYSTRV